MTTLRRELIQLIEKKILESSMYAYSSSWQDEYGMVSKELCEKDAHEFSEQIADLALDLIMPKQKPAFDMDSAEIGWKMLAGADIKQEDIDKAVLEKMTIDAFESAFSIKGNWNWYPAKPSEMRVWEDFRARLIKIYQADKDAFTKYVTWAAQPYSRGAMAGLQIKRNPQDFPDAWASFCMGTGYKPPRQVVPDSERTDLDDDGIPQSYM